MSQNISIDTSTLVRFWLVILGFFLLGLFLVKAWSGLVVVGIAIFLTLSIRPLGAKFNELFSKRKVKNREKLANILAFLVVVAILCVILLIIGPIVVSETSKFFASLPAMFEDSLGGWEGINEFGRNFGINDLQSEIVAAISGMTSGFLGNFGNIVGSIGNVFGMIFMAIVLTIFFLLEGREVYNRFWEVINRNGRDRSIVTIRRIIRKMGDVVSTFMGKQVSIALIDGIVVAFIVFLLSLIFGFSADLAFPLGLISMIFYLIPMFGQIIGCVVNILVLMVSSPLAGLVYGVCYLIYAQVEGNVIAPKMQGNALSLPPMIVLVSIVVGTYALGLIGAIIAIPIAGCIKVLIEEYPNLKGIRG